MILWLAIWYVVMPSDRVDWYAAADSEQLAVNAGLAAVVPQ